MIAAALWSLPARDVDWRRKLRLTHVLSTQVGAVSEDTTSTYSDSLPSTKHNASVIRADVRRLFSTLYDDKAAAAHQTGPNAA